MDIMADFEELGTGTEPVDKKKQGRPPKSKPPPPMPPPHAAPPPVSNLEMTLEEKTHILDTLAAYRERFSYLKRRNTLSVKSTPDELRDELAYVEMQLGSRKDTGAAGTVLCTALTTLEVLTRDRYNPLGLDLTGLGQIARDNMEDLQPLIDEIAIKYSTGMSMPVEVRLAMSIGVLVYTVHSANTGNARVAEVLARVSKPIKVPPGSADL
jgi:hypothetical protein